MRAMTTYGQAAGATAATVAGMKAQFGLLVDRSITIAGPYLSDMENWEYVWGSNRAKSNRVLWLLYAARFGATGSHTAAEAVAQAENYLHHLRLRDQHALRLEHGGDRGEALRVAPPRLDGTGPPFSQSRQAVLRRAIPRPPRCRGRTRAASATRHHATGPFGLGTRRGLVLPRRVVTRPARCPRASSKNHAPGAGRPPPHARRFCAQGVDAQRDGCTAWRSRKTTAPYQGR
jgi:hypothetical protein